MGPITGSVYVLTSRESDKQYVGITTRSVHQRFLEHVNNAIKKNTDTPLCRAIRKYGSDNFIVETLELCQSLDELKSSEQTWIQKLETFAKGYNATIGGDGVCGYKLTPSQLQKKSDGQRSSPHFKRTPVVQLNAKGDVVATFSTILDATFQTKIAHIHDVITGKRIQAGGFFWSNVDNVESTVTDIKQGILITKRPEKGKTLIAQLDEVGNVLATFRTSAEAFRATGISHIKDVVSGRRLKAGGFSWCRINA